MDAKNDKHRERRQDVASRKLAGAAIRKRRVELDMDQTNLAHRLGCTQARISAWENGKVEPGKGYESKLCEILGLSLEDLRPGHSVPSTGATEMTNEVLRSVLNNPEWRGLTPQKRQHFIALLNDVDVADYEVKSILAILLRQK